MGKRDQDCSSLGRDVGQARSAALHLPALLLVWQSVGYLVNYDDLEHLTQAPGVLGVRKTDDVEVGRLLAALQGAGRSRRCNNGCGCSDFPTLGEPFQLLQPTLRGLRPGLCDQVLDAEMDNRILFQC